MKKGKQYLTTGILLVLVLSIGLAGCASQKESAVTLTPFEYAGEMAALPVSYDNGNNDASLDIHIFLEPYKQPAYMADTLTHLTSLENAHVRIYDYPTRADIESFMVSGIGRCIEEQSPDLYLEYLNRLVDTDDIYDELVMAALAKEILGENYNRRCLQTNTKELKKFYENDNPLSLEELPATVINGYLFYGDHSIEGWQGIIETIQSEESSS